VYTVFAPYSPLRAQVSKAACRQASFETEQCRRFKKSQPKKFLNSQP
jgi:hypothetical protein